jgi:hypothetical protein
LEVPVWIVLDNYDIIFYAEGVDGFAASDAECAACRILTDALWMLALVCVQAYGFMHQSSVSYNLIMTVKVTDTHVTVYIKCGILPFE